MPIFVEANGRLFLRSPNCHPMGGFILGLNDASRSGEYRVDVSPLFLAVADGLSDFSRFGKTHPQVSKISISLVFNNLKF